MNRRELLLAGGAAIGRLALPAGVVAVAGCSASSALPAAPGFGGDTMGTTWSVRLGSALEPGMLRLLEASVRSVLEGVDARMSTYRSGSELSRFNQQRDGGWWTLSADTTAVLASALGTSEASGGAFDATVGPLVNLWGFGPDGAVGHAPAAREVAAMRERVGWRHVELDAERGAVRKHLADAYLDLSGIAKGFAVDAVAGALSGRGIGDFLVEVGGELASRGVRPDGGPWRVAVEQPGSRARRLQAIVDLRGRAIATSGDYRNFFDDAGRRFSHTIDPRTGSPVVHALASVSVIADSAVQADAASTALMVMGPEAGPDWARRHAVAALFLVRDGAALREQVTPAFAAHLAG